MRRKYTKAILIKHVGGVSSWSALIRSFGLEVCGGHHVTFHRRCKEFGINTSHFKGQAWNKGLTGDTHPSLTSMRRKNTKYNDDDLLVENPPYWVNGQILRRILVKKGVRYECSECSVSTWRDKPLSLHVDHINGINNDHRLGNLRFLCPNCHQQTATWGSRNRKK